MSGAGKALAAAFATILIADAAFACARSYRVEYEVENGRYQIELNGVYLESSEGSFMNGDTGLSPWFLRGENVVRVELGAASGSFDFYSICTDGSDRRSHGAATLEGDAEQKFSVTIDDPFPRVFQDAEPSTDEGLLEAVAALKSAIDARDFDAFWSRHGAMVADLENFDHPMKAEEWRMRKVVENIEPTYAPGLETYSVLGGRVWEVYGEGFAPPVEAMVKMNGGRYAFRTGSYWMKIDGVWTVLVR